MFMFSKVKVYSAPISVGSLPTWTEKADVGAILMNACGSGPNVASLVRDARRYGTPSDGSE